jgi:hypothetical protein
VGTNLMIYDVPQTVKHMPNLSLFLLKPAHDPSPGLIRLVRLQVTWQSSADL